MLAGKTQTCSWVWHLAHCQTDEAAVTSNRKASKLMCGLLSVFFDPHVLAQSSALGSRLNMKLDEDILSACIRRCITYTVFACNIFCMQTCICMFLLHFCRKHQSSSCLFYLNRCCDKCTQCRRSIKKTEEHNLPCTDEHACL